MTRSPLQFATWFAACGSVAALLACGAACADPPDRAARLAQVSGPVSFAPAGEDDWVLAQPNRPLSTGDRVWADSGAHAELQIGSASARLGSTTSVTLLNLDDQIAQFDLAQGTLDLRVRRIYPAQVYEIDTPNLAFSIRRAGEYRIDVDPAGNATVIRVRSGEGEAWGEGAAYTVGAGQQASFSGEGLHDYSIDPLPAPDAFDNWALGRDRHEDSAVAARYVSPDVVGYSDLDDYGSWRSVEGYGNVWFPTQVAADWVPYRSGHWAWVAPWGWTWVDDAPWGFAPFHYGRWANVSNRWCWVPGPIAVRPVYAPALVAFVGGAGFSLTIAAGPVAGIGWFPLGPGDVYRPGYAVSRNYFTNINVSNTVVNTTIVNNYYNNTNVTNVTYRNRELPGAVTAVPTNAFASAEPVAGHAIALAPGQIARASVTPVAAITPTRASVLAVAAVAGGAAAVAAARRPPAAVLSRQVVARTAPPPPPPAFAAKAQLLAAQPGKPLETEKLKGLAPARTAEATKVKVVQPSVTPQPLNKAGGGAGARGERAVLPAPAGQTQNQVPRPPQGSMQQQGKGPPAAAPQPPNERMKQESKGPPSQQQQQQQRQEQLQQQKLQQQQQQQKEQQQQKQQQQQQQRQEQLQQQKLQQQQQRTTNKRKSNNGNSNKSNNRCNNSNGSNNCNSSRNNNGSSSKSNNSKSNRNRKRSGCSARHRRHRNTRRRPHRRRGKNRRPNRSPRPRKRPRSRRTKRDSSRSRGQPAERLAAATAHDLWRAVAACAARRARGRLALEFDREHDRSLRALNALDAPDGVEKAVELFGAAALDAHLVVEHPRQRVHRTHPGPALELAHHPLTGLRVDIDQHLRGDALPREIVADPNRIAGNHPVALEPANALLHRRAGDTERARQRCGRFAGVAAQQAKQPLLLGGYPSIRRIIRHFARIIPA